VEESITYDFGNMEAYEWKFEWNGVIIDDFRGRNDSGGNGMPSSVTSGGYTYTRGVREVRQTGEDEFNEWRICRTPR
jgi:hypothetical protein